MSNWRRGSKSPNDPIPADDAIDATGDPLDPHMASTVRRSIDPRAQTQPLNSNEVPGSSSMPEWDTRRLDRKSRQPQAGSFGRFVPGNVRTFVQHTNNRQLLTIGGAILVVVVLALTLRALLGGGDSTAATSPTTPPTVSTSSSAPGLGVDPTVVGGAIDVAPPAADTFVPLDTPPVAAAARFVVINTGTDGLKIRDGAGGAQIGTFPEGTAVEALGEEADADGRTWIKVRGPQGEGWVAKEFLQSQ